MRQLIPSVNLLDAPLRKGPGHRNRPAQHCPQANCWNTRQGGAGPWLSVRAGVRDATLERSVQGWAVHPLAVTAGVHHPPTPCLHDDDEGRGGEFAQAISGRQRKITLSPSQRPFQLAPTLVLRTAADSCLLGLEPGPPPPV